MGYKVGDTVPFKVYIGATGKTINYHVIDESQNIGATQTMTEATLGWYYGTYVPDATGVWGVLTWCTLPTFSKAFTWQIGDGQEGNIDDGTTDTIMGKIGTDTEMADRSLFDLLFGDGPAVFQTALKAANNVSLSRVIRYISDEQIGEEFDGSPDIFDALVEGYTNSLSPDVDGGVLEAIRAFTHKNGSYTFNLSTDSLEAQRDALDTFVVNVMKYIADGDGSGWGGTVLPANISLYDIFGPFSTYTTLNKLSLLAWLGLPNIANYHSFFEYIVAGADTSQYPNVAADVDGAVMERQEYAQDAIDVIDGLVDSAEAAGPFSYLDAGGEQDVYEDTAVTRRRIWVVVSNRNMTKTGAFIIYRKVDGANYDIWITQAVSVGAGDDRAWDAEFTTNQPWKISYEEDADEGAARAIPYNVITQVIE